MAYYHQGVRPIADGTWPDLSLHGNDGTVSGAVTTAGDHVVFSTGVVASGLTMGDLVSASGGTGAYTVGAWFQYTGTDTQTYSALFGGKDSGGGTEWFIGKNHGNTALGVQDGNYLRGFASSPGVFDESGRSSAHSLIFSRSERQSDGTYTGTVYIDGTRTASSSFTGVNEGEELTIGMEDENSGYAFTGNVWQALILSRALSDAEALQLHETFAAGGNYCI